MATTEQANKELVRRFVEDAWSDGDLDLVEELVASDAVYHDPTLPDRPRGPDGSKQSIELYQTAFPDIQIRIEELIAEDDVVAARMTGTGTHEGEIMGIEPTGRRVEAPVMEFRRIEDGQIAEMWALVDTLGMLQQIGAIPEGLTE